MNKNLSAKYYQENKERLMKKKKKKQYGCKRYKNLSQYEKNAG